MFQDSKGGLEVLWIVLISIAILIGLPLLLAVLGLINLPFLTFESKVNLNQGVITRTYNTDFCLNNYEWFKDTDNSIQQADVQAQNFQTQIDQFKQTFGNDPTKWNYSATQQYSTLTTDLTGVENYKSQLIGEYNSKASQLDRVACKNLPLYIQP